MFVEKDRQRPRFAINPLARSKQGCIDPGMIVIARAVVFTVSSIGSRMIIIGSQRKSKDFGSDLGGKAK